MISQIALPTFQAVHKSNSVVTTSGTFTFSNCNATGNNGPIQSQVNSAYSGTSLDGDVTINTQGIQEWTVPYTTTYTIEVWGAEGGAGASYSSTIPGKGAYMIADFSLNSGTVLKIIVGQKPTGANSGGGGGSFVVKSDNTALIIAGGGGGAPGSCCSSPQNGGDGTITTSGTSGSGNTGNRDGDGGTGGNGGSGGNPLGSGGGGGFSGNGGNGVNNSSTAGGGGKSFLNSGVGGTGHNSNF